MLLGVLILKHIRIDYQGCLERENLPTRIAMVREKYLENEFFPGQGKVRKFCGWPGKFRKDLESQGI